MLFRSIAASAPPLLPHSGLRPASQKCSEVSLVIYSSNASYEFHRAEYYNTCAKRAHNLATTVPSGRPNFRRGHRDGHTNSHSTCSGAGDPTGAGGMLGDVGSNARYEINSLLPMMSISVERQRIEIFTIASFYDLSRAKVASLRLIDKYASLVAS